MRDLFGPNLSVIQPNNENKPGPLSTVSRHYHYLSSTENKKDSSRPSFSSAAQIFIFSHTTHKKHTRFETASQRKWRMNSTAMRNKVQRKFKMRGYTLRVDALKEILGFITRFPEAEDEALDLLLDELHNVSCNWLPAFYFKLFGWWLLLFILEI